MRLALIGDIHIFRLVTPPWSLMSKRLIGHANLWLNRRHAFKHILMEKIVEQIHSIEPDMLLLAGDLTTTALEGEFLDVADLLRPLTSEIETVAVPGNHDRYTFTAARVKRMEKMLPQFVPQRFPDFRKIKDRWHLLALDGAVPRLLNARGRLGVNQLRHAADHLGDLTEEHGLVVLCHYPIKNPPRVPPATYDHKLAESGRLKRMLHRCPARIVYVHGHIHRPWCWQPRRSDQAHITYINAGAPCMTNGRHPMGQGFWQVDLPDEPHGHMSVIHHVPLLDDDALRNGQPMPTQIESWEARRVL